MLLLQVVFLAMLLLLCVRVWRYSFFSPPFLFAAGFEIASIFCLLRSGAWNYSMSLEAFLTISGGCFIFFATALMSDFLFVRSKPFELVSRKRAAHSTELSIWVIVTLLVFQAVILVLTLGAIKGLHPTQSLADAILDFRNSNTFTAEGDTLPVPLRQLRQLLICGMPYIAYLFVSAIKEKKRRQYILVLLLNLAVNFVLCISSGGRQAAIELVACGVILYLISRYRNNIQWEDVKRPLIIIGVAALAVLLSFQFIAIGRSHTESAFEYLSIYIGAPIHNLDVFIHERLTTIEPPVWGYMTFIRTINYLGKALGISDWVYPLDLPFVVEGALATGNVYTTFYAWLYDFKWAGMVIVTIAMSLLSQALYRKVLREGGGIIKGIVTAIYSYVAVQVFFSFFSNKFFESVVSIGFLIRLLYSVVFVALLYGVQACSLAYKRRAIFQRARIANHELY